MIIKEQQSNTKVIGDVESNGVGIDKDNIQFLTTLLSTNLYSDPEGSFIRENVSNAWDSHVEAGNTDPIMVQLDYEKMEDTYFCLVKDQGVGISPERFDKIYRNIGSSTKRSDNKAIGGFGIGRFSSLSVSNSVSITSYHDGIVYKYLMYKDGDKIQIDLVYQAETEEVNGVEVRLNITRDQAHSIHKYILNNFTFFENLYLVSEHFDVDRFNNNKIKKFELFSVSSYRSQQIKNTYKDYFISVLNGKILYPLDLNHVNVPDILKNKDININLEIGELSVTPNRENIIYTEETKKLLQDKLDAIALHISTFTKPFENLNSFDEVIAYFCNSYVTVPVMPDVEWQMRMLPKFKGVSCDHVYKGLFEKFIHRCKAFENKIDKVIPLNYVYTTTVKRSKVARGDYKKLKLNHKAYFRQESGIDLILRLDSYTSFIKECLSPISSNRKHVKTVLRQIFDYHKALPSIEDIVPTQAWLDAKKANRKKVTRSQELIAYDNYTSHKKTKVDFKDLYKTCNIIIPKSREHELGIYHEIFKYGHHNIKFLSIADTKVKQIKNYENISSMEFDVFKGKHNKHLMRVATARYLEKHVTNKRIGESFFHEVKTSCKRPYEIVESYVNKYGYSGYNSEANEIVDSLVELYESNNAFDPYIMQYYNKNKTNFKYGFIHTNMCNSPEMEKYFLKLVMLEKEFRPDYKYVNKIKNENT